MRILTKITLTAFVFIIINVIVNFLFPFKSVNPIKKIIASGTKPPSSPQYLIDRKYDENYMNYWLKSIKPLGPLKLDVENLVVNDEINESYVKYNYWLLPDKTTGWVEFIFDQEYIIKEIAILNTYHRAHKDRAAIDYEIYLIDSNKAEGVKEDKILEDKLPFYPKWKKHIFYDDSHIATALRINIQSFYKQGAGINEVKITAVSTNKYDYYRYNALITLVSLLLTVLLTVIVFKTNTAASTILIGALIGAIYFIYVLGVLIIIPTNIDWLLSCSDCDYPTHFLGWHFFRNEAWTFPIGLIKNYNAPVGTSIAYTDSIPLFAILFKLFTGLLPKSFQYFGLWLFICFCMQGVFGALLIRTRTDNVFIQTIGSAFFVLSPVLLFRIGHAALTAQWQILAALWLYFNNWNRQRQFTAFILWLSLLAVSALTHPYLLLMALSIGTAFFIRLYFEYKDIALLFSLMSQFAVFSLIIFIGWWSSGYFTVGKASNLGGGLGTYGYYSFNVSSFFNPMSWSSFLKDRPLVSDGQADGFSYFGAGSLIIILWAIYAAVAKMPTRKTLKHLLPLLLTAILAALFSITNTAAFDNEIIFNYDLNFYLYGVLTIFRASGRFIWILYYLLLFIALAVIIRRTSSKTALILLTIALSLQFADISNKITGYRKYNNPVEWDFKLKSDSWNKLSRNRDKILFVPPRFELFDYKVFAYYASNNSMSINIGYLARKNNQALNEYESSLLDDIRNNKLDNKAIYIVERKYLSYFDNVTAKCSNVDGFNVCLKEDSLFKK
ncbi:hypothetical protein MCHI_002478 [Candidatus Magnetoovum chiemensis]|nr:hypothetical protein MCHI_002478 [Candidatus Magnetoovum chiemensis]